MTAARKDLARRNLPQETASIDTLVVEQTGGGSEIVAKLISLLAEAQEENKRLRSTASSPITATHVTQNVKISSTEAKDIIVSAGLTPDLIAKLISLLESQQQTIDRLLNILDNSIKKGKV